MMASVTETIIPALDEALAFILPIMLLSGTTSFRLRGAVDTPAVAYPRRQCRGLCHHAGELPVWYCHR